MEKDKLYVDDREPLKIRELLEKQDIKYEETRLLTGDFVFNNWVFERKTMIDLYGSLMSGRIFNQIENMKMNYDNVVLIISGNFKQCYFAIPNFNENVIHGAIASFITKQHIQVIRVDNDSQLIKMVKLIIEKSSDIGVINVVKIRKMTDEDVYLSMLCCIDKVGVNKAKNILTKYKFKDIPNLTIEQLKEIDGVGTKIAENIKKYL